MLTTRDNSDFFIKYSKKTIQSLFINEPCKLFFFKLLNLITDAEPLQVHNKLLRMNHTSINGLIRKVDECACISGECFNVYFTNTCSKNKMKLLLKAYQNWNKRNISQLSVGNHNSTF